MIMDRNMRPVAGPAGATGVDLASAPVLHEKRITLDARLSALAVHVAPCERYADIGCDHGRLGAYLLKTGRVARAQLTDISDDSLRKARRLIGMLGLADRVRFCVGDGAMALEETPEVTVIAGMGGSTICRILTKGRMRLGASKLVLQPNVDAPALRRTLCGLGYRISDEQIVCDGRWRYVIICAESGAAGYSDAQIEIGPVLLERRPPELKPYAAFRVRVAQKALEGALAGGDDPAAERLKAEYDIWKGVLECL
ncbi:MAG: SAM-dependent methyltransferase [Clostridia bacterium]|nr:SAM-dependent methyltransferase [Clostridia bacterium]